MTRRKSRRRSPEYLLELGPSIVPKLLSHLKDPSPAIRADVAEVLGALGTPDSESPSAASTQDTDRAVARGGDRAIAAAA